MPFSRLPTPLAEALSERGYAAPTAVQAAVIEPAADGRDLIVSAQTGSGKTVAFGMAMAVNLFDAEGRLPAPAHPLALVIAPTRELALQVARELQWLYAKVGARITSCVGGMDPSRERRTLSHGTHIVVGTPGRLRDHLERGALDLSALRVAVLDEADEMLDMGFREDLEEILDATPAGRRTLLFSATMPKPIVALARRYQKDALAISTIGAERGHGDIAYQAVTVAPSDIENACVNLLRFHEPDTAILFCATREAVNRLHASLVDRGFAAVALSGEHSQSERNHALQALRDRRARVCVATDVAARGIDLPSLSLVIHAELPRDAEALQHRSGRTGRAGKKGIAVLVVPYQRRRRTEGMLRDARIQAEWVPVPIPAQVREADRERLIATLSQPQELDEEDRALGGRLLAERGADEVAAMLVRAHRARLPAAEELLEGGAVGPRVRDEGPRAGFEDTMWFRMNIGRRQNADPRWLLPLLCRRGHITKSEIGAIRIANEETAFEVPRAVAAKFAAALKRTASADPEGELLIVPMQGPPERMAGGPPRGRPSGPRPPLGARPPFKGPAPPAMTPRILVDADACPVKDEIYKVAWRLGVPVTIVSNSHLRVPAHPLVTRVVVSDGFDAADDWIAARAGADAVVVTADILLADRCLKAGATVLSPTGKGFTTASIGGAIAIRAIMADLRAGGEQLGGPPPFGKADRSRFLSALDQALTRIARSS